MQGTRLQAVETAQPQLITDEPPQPAQTPTPRKEAASTWLLLTSLRALGQRAIVALAQLVDLALIGSVFALCLLIVSAPTVPQLIEAAGYAVFVIAAIMLRRRH